MQPLKETYYGSSTITDPKRKTSKFLSVPNYEKRKSSQFTDIEVNAYSCILCSFEFKFTSHRVQGTSLLVLKKLTH